MSKSSSVTSVKYRKLFLGIIISIVFGIAGAVIWIFGESGVSRASIVPFFALGVIVSFVLTVVMSIILFQKAIVFAIITFALAVIGSLISYLLAYYKAD